MLGKIIEIENNLLLVKPIMDIKKFKNIVNLYVSIVDGDKKFIGEIISIKNNIFHINLIGEFEEDLFMFGTSHKPSFNSIINLMPLDEVNNIIGLSNYNEAKTLLIGKSMLYDNINIGVDINKFFSNHFAIFGTTGSGKSCGVARIFQNLFEKEKILAYNASVLIFDAYGEYHNAFSKLNEKDKNINFKIYTTNANDNFPLIKIPLWLLNVDDIALLLESKNPNDLPIIEKSLKLLTIFSKKEEEVLKIKNDIIARAILDVLSSGKKAPQIRDQIITILTHYNTSELNLNTKVAQIGYVRPLKTCLYIDDTGKISDMELITNLMYSFLTDEVELSLPDGSFKWNLNDLYNAFEFALISEGIFNNNKIYENFNTLKIRLRNLMNSSNAVFFDLDKYMTKNDFIKEILTVPNGKKAQIINFNINYVDDRLAKTITKIYTRIFFDYVKDLKERATLPIHIILEEAHRYVQNDSDVDVIGYNIFERVTKEGRKYGILLGLISQRPSELSATVLSQCSNFIIFRMSHPVDIEYIRQILPHITMETLEKIKYLQTGSCIAFGTGFKIPTIIKLDMPNPSPSSDNCDVSGIWFVTKK